MFKPKEYAYIVDENQEKVEVIKLKKGQKTIYRKHNQGTLTLDRDKCKPIIWKSLIKTHKIYLFNTDKVLPLYESYNEIIKRKEDGKYKIYKLLNPAQLNSILKTKALDSLNKPKISLSDYIDARVIFIGIGVLIAGYFIMSGQV